MVVNSIMEFPTVLAGIPLSIPIPLTGAWQTYRYPMGASCTLDNECGICANSGIELDYGNGKKQVCKNGIPTDKNTQSVEPKTEKCLITLSASIRCGRMRSIDNATTSMCRSFGAKTLPERYIDIIVYALADIGRK